MPTKPNKRGGDRESTRKRIQNNDNKNDPKSGKQNGVTDKQPEKKIEKMQEMLNKDLEEIKKSQLKMNNAIEIKNTLEESQNNKGKRQDK